MPIGVVLLNSYWLPCLCSHYQEKQNHDFLDEITLATLISQDKGGTTATLQKNSTAMVLREQTEMARQSWQPFFSLALILVGNFSF